MKSRAVCLNLSIVSCCAAFALMFYAMLGASVAPAGQPGAFDFFIKPAVGCAVIALGLLMLGRWLPPTSVSTHQATDSA